jgi:hypothetical protein
MLHGPVWVQIENKLFYYEKKYRCERGKVVYLLQIIRCANEIK